MFDENDVAKTFYGGIEPTDVGDLTDVKEIRQVIPATKGVRVRIKKAEHQINNENTYRQISLQLLLTEGIDEEGKYKGKVVFARVCYYADPNVYVKDFFKNKQHLVQLKYLLNATGLQGSIIDGHIFEKLGQAPEISCDIAVKKRTYVDSSGTSVEVTENEAKNFKELPLEALV